MDVSAYFAFALLCVFVTLNICSSFNPQKMASSASFGVIYTDAAKMAFRISFGKKDGDFHCLSVVRESGQEGTLVCDVKGVSTITSTPQELKIESRGLSASGPLFVAMGKNMVSSTGLPDDFVQQNCPIQMAMLDGKTYPVIQVVESERDGNFMFCQNKESLVIFPHDSKRMDFNLGTFNLGVECVSEEPPIHDGEAPMRIFEMTVSQKNMSIPMRGKTITYNGFSVVLCESLAELQKSAVAMIPVRAVAVAPKAVVPRVAQQSKPAPQQKNSNQNLNKDDGFKTKAPKARSPCCICAKPGKLLPDNKNFLCFDCCKSDSDEVDRYYVANGKNGGLALIETRDGDYRDFCNHIVEVMGWNDGFFIAKKFMQDNFPSEMEAFKNDLAKKQSAH